MVGTPKIDDKIEPTEILILVISQIRGQVSGHAVRSDHHPVFFVSLGGGAKPESTVFFINQAGGSQGLDYSGHCAVLIKTLFTKPAIIKDPEIFQVLTNSIENTVSRIITE